jgi:hypothetical protein
MHSRTRYLLKRRNRRQLRRPLLLFQHRRLRQHQPLCQRRRQIRRRTQHQYHRQRRHLPLLLHQHQRRPQHRRLNNIAHKKTGTSSTGFFILVRSPCHYIFIIIRIPDVVQIFISHGIFFCIAGIYCFLQINISLIGLIH